MGFIGRILSAPFTKLSAPKGNNPTQLKIFNGEEQDSHLPTTSSIQELIADSINKEQFGLSIFYQENFKDKFNTIQDVINHINSLDPNKTSYEDGVLLLKLVNYSDVYDGYRNNIHPEILSSAKSKHEGISNNALKIYANNKEEILRLASLRAAS